MKRQMGDTNDSFEKAPWDQSKSLPPPPLTPTFDYILPPSAPPATSTK